MGISKTYFDIEKFNFNFEKQSGELKTKWETKI